MRTKHIFVTLSRLRIKRGFARVKLVYAPFNVPTDHSKVVSLLQFFFVRLRFHIWNYILSVFVPPFSLFSCFGMDMLRHCGISGVNSFVLFCLFSLSYVITFLLIPALPRFIRCMKHKIKILDEYKEVISSFWCLLGILISRLFTFIVTHVWIAFVHLTTFISAAQCENVSSVIYRQRRPRSAYASAQFDQDLTVRF